MTVGFATLLHAVWRLWRGGARLGGRIAGAFVFLPSFAALLLCDPLPPLPAAPRDQAAMAAWLDAVTAWGQGNALFYVLADLAGIFGVAAIAVLLLDPDRPTVGGALRIAARRIVPFALVSAAVAVPVGLGMWLFVLPGLYVQARLIVALPALAHQPRLRTAAALRSSMATTRGYGWPITGALTALFLAQWLAVVPLYSSDEWLRAPGHENPVVLALVVALVAGIGTAFHVATLLLGVVVYRWRRASSGT
jgi:hypothetical protein